MAEKYRDPNNKGKRNRENGYENRRGVDMISEIFGGMLGDTVGKVKERKKKNEKAGQ